MSYSFGIKAPTKEAAKREVASQLAQVVISQPVHALDAHTAQVTACAIIDTLAEPAANEEVGVSVGGYLAWGGSGEKYQEHITSANVSVTAGLQQKGD